MAIEMNICSHHETTIDYPGKMGVIIFCPGCNFKCGFCHNPEVVLDKAGRNDTAILLKNIESRKNAGWYQAVIISGGEPTIQQGLVEFCKKLKEIGVFVKLDTNGSNPNLLRVLLDLGYVDYVAMDIKASREKYPEICCVNVNIEDIEKSMKLAVKFPVHEFRTTILPFFSEKDIQDIGEWVNKTAGRPELWTIQQFSIEKTLDPEFAKLVPKTPEEIDKIGKILEKYAERVRVLR